MPADEGQSTKIGSYMKNCERSHTSMDSVCLDMLYKGLCGCPQLLLEGERALDICRLTKSNLWREEGRELMAVSEHSLRQPS